MRETFYAVHGYEVIPCHVIAGKDRRNGLKYAADSRRDRRRFPSAFRTRKEAEAIERYRLKESSYIDTKINIYSCELVRLARKRNCNEIILIDAKIPEEEQEAKFLLRNWSYAGLRGKIEYKAKKEGITVKII